MSLGIFDQTLRWWWDSPDRALIELPDYSQIEVRFHNHGDDAKVARRLGYEDADDAADMDFSVVGDTSYGTMTGRGHAASVVNTVAIIIGRWLMRAEPPLLSFHAEDKRARVYEAMAQRIVVPGYALYRSGNPASVYGADYAVLREPVPNRGALLDSGAVRVK